MLEMASWEDQRLFSLPHSLVVKKGVTFLEVGPFLKQWHRGFAQ